MPGSVRGVPGLSRRKLGARARAWRLTGGVGGVAWGHDHIGGVVPVEKADMFHGACFCGALRYEASGAPTHRGNCHCSMCRGTTGAPFVAWFTVPRAGFRYTQGKATRFHSSARVTRGFCPHCGTQLTFEEEGGADDIDVTVCSLDDPERLPPRKHICASSKRSWVKLADGLPEYRDGGDGG